MNTIKTLLQSLLSQLVGGVRDSLASEFAAVAAHFPKAALYGLLWSVAMFATLAVISAFLINAAAFWTLPAFVLPLAVVFVIIRPKFPPKS